MLSFFFFFLFLHCYVITKNSTSNSPSPYKRIKHHFSNTVTCLKTGERQFFCNAAVLHVHHSNVQPTLFSKAAIVEMELWFHQSLRVEQSELLKQNVVSLSCVHVFLFYILPFEFFIYTHKRLTSISYTRMSRFMNKLLFPAAGLNYSRKVTHSQSNVKGLHRSIMSQQRLTSAHLSKTSQGCEASLSAAIITEHPFLLIGWSEGEEINIRLMVGDKSPHQGAHQHNKNFIHINI